MKPLRMLSWPLMALLLLLSPTLFGGSSALYSVCTTIAIFAVMAYGLDLIVSDLGEVSLAHPVFFAVGAYTAAIASTRYGLGPIETLVLSIIVVLGVVGFIAFVTLRLHSFIFSLVTYAVTVVAMTLASNWAFLGGSDGIPGIPAFEVFGYRAVNEAQLWPIAWGLLLVTLILVVAFRRSKMGYAAMTVHLNPALARSSGISPERIRMQVFLASAPITASAGWLYAYQRAYVSADILSPYFLILMLTAVVLVGRRYILAPLAGIAIILFQERFLSYGAYVDRIILGSVLVLVLSFLPGGLVGLFRDLNRRIGRSRQPHAESQTLKT
ncbi:branched-chain amino acid ABC transporter permease [Vreelandella glaciei]|jgi:branched-chain amino acid transport system permease protein|uniref:branched-chain amino acid ABC transporter permease n=1 Tax=Vreelandella glaciei TaxID=186761 RepID=UPI0030016F9F